MNKKPRLPILILCMFVWALASCRSAQDLAASDRELITPIPPAITEVSPSPSVVVRDDRDSATPQSEIGTWKTFQHASQALAGNLINDPEVRTIHVYLPPSYEVGDAAYPVLYALHGYLEDPTWLRGMGLKLDSLIANGEAQEMILVFPDANNHFGGSFYLSSPTIGDYESYIAKELVAHVDANYRTISNRTARGVAGCSMGGNGALHLAFAFPDVFGTAAAASGGYAFGDYPQWQQAIEAYSEHLVPEGLNDIARLPWFVRVMFAMAAAAAPNPSNSPFFFDFPFEIDNGNAQAVSGVLEKIADADVVNDVREYLDQPLRLRGIAIYHGILDDGVPVSMASSFSEFLTDQNVEHEFVKVDDGHCDRSWDYGDLLKFMSANLLHE